MNHPRLLLVCAILGAGLGGLVWWMGSVGGYRSVGPTAPAAGVAAIRDRAELAAVVEPSAPDRSFSRAKRAEDPPTNISLAPAVPLPLVVVEDWSLSRLPNHTEALKDPDLNPRGRVLSLEEKKALGALLRERNLPISMKALHRDDLVRGLLSAKIQARAFEHGTPVVHEIFFERVPQSEDKAAYVALYPGENEEVDALHDEIKSAIAAARAEIRAYLGP